MPQLYFVITCILMLANLNANAQPAYTIAGIPDSLKLNANAVIRQHNSTLEIVNDNRALLTVRSAISVLNDAGEDLAAVSVYYNTRERVKYIRANLLNADGNIISKFDKRNASDFSTNNWLEAGDGRVKVIDLNLAKVPYTVEYEYQVEYLSLFFIPDWNPIDDYQVALQNASFTLIHPANVEVKVAPINIDPAEKGADNSSTWEIAGLPALSSTDYIGNIADQLPQVIVSPRLFNCFGVYGSMDSWEAYGKFIDRLNIGRDELPVVLDPELAAIYNTKMPDLDRAKQLYTYIQKRQRYVAIERGLGGWQPQTAAFTFEKNYGDCKALSMLMKALLKKAGIDSYYVLIYAGPNPLPLPGHIPCNRFNHAILCAPVAGDTLWFECTSPINPYNYLGSFTENRDALLVYNGGARIVHTPVYNELNNQSINYAEFTLSTDKAVKIKGHVLRKGEMQEELRAVKHGNNPQKLESAMYHVANTPNTHISSYSITTVDMDKPELKLSIEMQNQNSIRESGSRLFIRTDIFKPQVSVPAKNEKRQQPIKTNTGFTQTDTLIYNLPVGYQAESFKSGITKQIKEIFGELSYMATYNEQDGKLVVFRSLCLKESTYPANQFSSFRDFLYRISREYSPEMVLKRVE